jgi:hypothetical protein
VTFGFGGTCIELSDGRVVQTEAFDGYPGESVVTTTYVEHDGKTTMKIVVRFESQQIRDAVVATGMTKGAGESYDELEKLLGTLSP